MGEKIAGFFSNDSPFGQFMIRVGILIVSSILFAVTTVPIVTIGPGLAALYTVMLKVLRGDRELGAFRTFWKAFAANFRQAFFTGLVFLALAFLVYADIRFCRAQGGSYAYFGWAVILVGLFIAAVAAYFYPVLAAFDDTVPHLLRNALFFASRRPLKMLLVLAIDVVPLYLTYRNRAYLPLTGFLWVVIGYGLAAYAVSALLVKDFAAYLPKVNEEGSFVDEEGNLLTKEEANAAAREEREGGGKDSR